MQPHIIRLPPPCLAVPLTWRSVSLLPSCFHTQLSPSDPIRLTFVSSDQTTRFQSSTVQCWCCKANSRRWWVCLGKSRGFFLCTAFSPSSFRPRRTVWALTFLLVTSLSCRVSWTALSALPE